MIKSYAFGQLGLSLSEYANCTQYEYNLKCKGHEEKILISWKQTRQVAFVQMMSAAEPSKVKGLTPELWWPLESKQKEEVPIYKRKNFKALAEKFKHVKR